MSLESERLLEGLSELREDRRSIGPHHPKFVEWLASVRQCLAGAEDRSGLDRFSVLRVSRVANAMWRREELPPTEYKEVLADLDEVEGILRALVKADRTSGCLQSARPRHDSAHRADFEDPSANGDPPSTKEPSVNKSADASGRPEGLQPGRFEAMEALLSDLGAELKRPEGDMDRIQKMMGDLLDLKKTGDLVERALSAAAAPGARWDSVRAPLAQLWAANRDVALDIIPALLKKA